jgi:hypothetical protein
MMLLFPSSSRSTLCTEEVLTFLNTRMLFWACSTSRPEGYRGTQPSTLALRLHYLDLLELEIRSTKRNWPLPSLVVVAVNEDVFSVSLIGLNGVKDFKK